MSERMGELDVGVLSDEIFLQMSSFSRWWEPSYVKSTDDETWGGWGVEWGSDEYFVVYALCKSSCASKCAQGTAQNLV